MDKKNKETLQQIKNFHVLPVQLGPGPFKKFLYMRQQAEKKIDQQEQNQKQKRDALFVLNLWPDCSEDLRQIFSHFGEVERIDLFKENQKKNQNPLEVKKSSEVFASAQILFTSDVSLNRAVRPRLDDIEDLRTDRSETPKGLHKWLDEYQSNRVDAYILEQEINESLKRFDEKQQEERERLAKLTNQPDADGFVVVRRKKAKPTVTQTISENLALSELSQEDALNVQKVLSSLNYRNRKLSDSQKRKEKKRNKLQEFYKFQRKEKEKQHIVELRKRFTEDKEKVARMKAMRRFQPY